jgi:hypothetical protein
LYSPGQGIACQACEPTQSTSSLSNSPNDTFCGDAGFDFYCEAGSCGAGLVLATGGDNAENLAVDSTSVYWTNPLSGDVLKTPLGGGTSTQVAFGAAPTGIAVFGTDVFWVDNGPGSDPTEGAVLQVGLSIPLAASQTRPDHLAVNSTSVYWADGSAIMTVGRNGGTPTVLTYGQYPDWFALDSTSLYWTDYQTVMKVSLDGGTAVALATAEAAEGIAVSPTQIYWASESQLLSVGLDGGTPATLASHDTVWGVAVDSSYVYWTELGGLDGGGVYKTGLNGGPIIPIALGQATPAGIALDATYVYWVNNSDGTVRRSPK